jgi:hypothetical protein
VTSRTEKINQLRSKASDSGRRKSGALVGEELTEAGLLDHAVLNQQTNSILDGFSDDQALAPQIERHLDAP